MINRPLEIEYWRRYEDILGMDEAGRGPICGPLVVSGVIFEKGYHNEMIDDSKKLTEKKREALYDIIIHDAKYCQILFVDEKTIDRLNIYQATRQAMIKIALDAPCDFVLTDAMPLRIAEKQYQDIVKGDQKSLSIAAASILAKVSRDRWMKHLDQLYPQYGLAAHKGYPTKAHIEAIKTYGIQSFYRHSYNPVKEMEAFHLF